MIQSKKFITKSCSNSSRMKIICTTIISTHKFLLLVYIKFKYAKTKHRVKLINLRLILEKKWARMKLIWSCKPHYKIKSNFTPNKMKNHIKSVFNDTYLQGFLVYLSIFIKLISAKEICVTHFNSNLFYFIWFVIVVVSKLVECVGLQVYW